MFAKGLIKVILWLTVFSSDSLHCFLASFLRHRERTVSGPLNYLDFCMGRIDLKRDWNLESLKNSMADRGKAKKFTTFLLDFAARFCGRIIISSSIIIFKIKRTEWIQSPASESSAAHCVLMCGYDGVKIVVNKVVTLKRLWAKGYQGRRVGDVVLPLLPYCHYIGSSVLLYLKNPTNYKTWKPTFFQEYFGSRVLRTKSQ